VEYIFNFTTVSGEIDGTLEILPLWNVHCENLATYIRSIRGTGDLRNAQILATSGVAGHEGIVIG
jgi:hypothetical protein